MASTLLQSISQNDIERANALSRKKYRTDLESDMRTAIKNREIEIALSLFDVLDVETIAEKTGFSVEFLNQLKEKQI